MMNVTPAGHPDHRIFGFTPEGQLRVSLFNGPNAHASGALYSWLVCATSRQLANKLADQWGQSLSEDEQSVLEELESSNAEPTSYTAEVEIDCDECDGSGIDPGGLSAFESEDCPVCHGSKRQTITRNYLNEAWAIVAGQSLMLPERKHLEALAAHARALTNVVCEPKANKIDPAWCYGCDRPKDDCACEVSIDAPAQSVNTCPQKVAA
jgi:hypothetical protein